MSVIKPGSRLQSQVDSTQVIVVRASDAEGELTCGGHPLIDIKAEPEPGLTLAPEFSVGSPLGKRFVDEAATVELLVTRAGDGSLALGGSALVLKEAKPLPSSD